MGYAMNPINVECVKHLRVGSGEHIGVSPLTNRRELCIVPFRTYRNPPYNER